MPDFIPASDYWWRYFIYGALFHFAAVTPLIKTDRHANLLRTAGYVLGAVPVLLREGVLPALWMIILLYGWTISLQYVKRMFR